MDDQMSDGIVYLMYHEIERAGRELCEREQGYVRYVISESAFASISRDCRRAGFKA